VRLAPHAIDVAAIKREIAVGPKMSKTIEAAQDKSRRHMRSRSAPTRRETTGGNAPSGFHARRKNIGTQCVACPLGIGTQFDLVFGEASPVK